LFVILKQVNNQTPYLDSFILEDKDPLMTALHKIENKPKLNWMQIRTSAERF
jgi:hypothetical protein